MSAPLSYEQFTGFMPVPISYEEFTGTPSPFKQFAGTTPSLEQLAAADPSMLLDTDFVSRGYVPRNELARLGKEKDAVIAAEKARELINYFPKDESGLKRYLRAHRGVIVTDDHIAQQPKDLCQLGAESGSFIHLQQLVDDVLARSIVLRFNKDSDLAEFAAQLIARGRSMKKGLEAYAKSRGLDLGEERTGSTSETEERMGLDLGN